MSVLKIGIECENLEGKRFGVGHTMAQLLDSVSKIPNIEKKYKFILYFKKEIPNDDFLNHPVFEKKIINNGILPTSFNIFYHILLPFYSLKDKIDLFYFPSYMLPAFFIGKAVVVLTNDVYFEAHHGSLPFRYKISYRLFCKWAALRAKKIMTISEFSKNELMKYYNLPENRIYVNYWGMGDQFKELPKNDENNLKIKKIKEKLNIENEFILSVGQAFERRKVKEAMQAFEKIANDFPNIQYLVPCIDKNNPPILDDLASEINKRLKRKAIIRVNYLDKEDIIHLFNNAKTLIYVSDKEALGLPPVEALLCNTPSVVIDNGLTHEILGDDGAFFVKDPNNIDNFANIIKNSLIDEDKRLKIKQNKKDTLAKFNWEKHSNKSLAEFEKIIKGKI